MQDVVIVAATRTAIGSFQGSLANVPAVLLGDRIAVPQLKFLSPLGPAQRIAIALRSDGRGVDFDVRCGAVTIARGRLARLT